MKRFKVDIEKIKKVRKESNISIDEMSSKLGYSSPNGYYYLEVGRGKFPAETLAEVSFILNIPISELFLDKKLP